MNGERLIIGIDPGRTKCGFAVLTSGGKRVALEVVPTGELDRRVEAVVAAGDVVAICVGHATTSESVTRLCRAEWPRIPIVVVDESNTTLEARQRYYLDHPPRGLLRLLPRGLLVPKAPLDGYAALLIAERYLHESRANSGPTHREPDLPKS